MAVTIRDMSPRCDSANCRRLAVLELHDLTDSTRSYRCDQHAPTPNGRHAAVKLRKVCDWCGKAMPLAKRPQGGGRARVYCSGTCRTGAHRSSTRAAAAGTDMHEAMDAAIND